MDKRLSGQEKAQLVMRLTNAVEEINKAAGIVRDAGLTVTFIITAPGGVTAEVRNPPPAGLRD